MTLGKVPANGQYFKHLPCQPNTLPVIALTPVKCRLTLITNADIHIAVPVCIFYSFNGRTAWNLHRENNAFSEEKNYRAKIMSVFIYYNFKHVFVAEFQNVAPSYHEKCQGGILFLDKCSPTFFSVSENTASRILAFNI